MGSLRAGFPFGAPLDRLALARAPARPRAGRCCLCGRARSTPPWVGRAPSRGPPGIVQSWTTSSKQICAERARGEPAWRGCPSRSSALSSSHQDEPSPARTSRSSAPWSASGRSRFPSRSSSFAARGAGQAGNGLFYRFAAREPVISIDSCTSHTEYDHQYKAIFQTSKHFVCLSSTA